MNGASVTAETILSTLAHLFAHEGKAREVAVLAHAKGEIKQTGYDNWDGGTYEYTLFLSVSLTLYVQITEVKSQCEEALRDKAMPLLGERENLRLDFRTFTGVVGSEKRADHHMRDRYPGGCSSTPGSRTARRSARWISLSPDSSHW